VKQWVSAVLLTAASAGAADEWKRPAEIEENVLVERCFAGGNSKQRYFLMRQKPAAQSTNKHGLVVILPGGPGAADFLPFCANILTLAAIPADFLVAELVAPEWRPGDDKVVWPSHAFPDNKAALTNETFLAAVIDEVSRMESIDERFVVRGSVIAMSRFYPDSSVETSKLKGKAYFLYHSPDDTLCPFSDAELAVKTLKEHGAEVKLVSYKGGHGWQPFTFYGDRIKEGILWLKQVNAAQ
jgi:hypothetical protein